MTTSDDPAAISRDEALSCIPEKHPDIGETLLESGELILHWKVPYRPLFRRLKFLFGSGGRAAYDKRLQLDGLGVRVWKLMDGKADVASIIMRFASDLCLHEREAEVSVTAFVRILGRKGLIRLKRPGR